MHKVLLVQTVQTEQMALTEVLGLLVHKVQLGPKVIKETKETREIKVMDQISLLFLILLEILTIGLTMVKDVSSRSFFTMWTLLRPTRM